MERTNIGALSKLFREIDNIYSEMETDEAEYNSYSGGQIPYEETAMYKSNRLILDHKETVCIILLKLESKHGN
jgi:hypothetical protein